MKTRFLLLAAAGLSLLGAIVGAADWPQWRGPLRNGISGETGLLKEWPTEGPALVWQLKDIGDGYSTPAVEGDRLYLMSNRGMDDEFVQSLDVKDGANIWSTRIGAVGPNEGPSYPGARSTPTVDSKLVYALGSDGNLACLDATTGDPVWQKSLRADFAGTPGKWAYAESPLIDGDVLVCTPGGAEATIVALNKLTGETIWKSAVPGGDPAAYASAIVVEVSGIKQYVQFLQHGVVGVNATTGEFLWRYSQTAEGSPANIATPIADDGLVYSGANRSGGGLIKLVSDGARVTVEPIYFEKGLPTSIGGAVKLGGYLYGTNGQALICSDFATGKVMWQDRCVGAAAVCYADERLFVRGDTGDVALVEATSEAYREKGRFTLPEQPDRGRSKAWSYPVLANGRLYMREMGALWCYEVSDPATK